MPYEPKSSSAGRLLIYYEHLVEKDRVEVGHLPENPQLAERKGILAVPTVVRDLLAPFRQFVGDFSNAEQTLVGLDFRPVSNL